MFTEQGFFCQEQKGMLFWIECYFLIKTMNKREAKRGLAGGTPEIAGSAKRDSASFPESQP